MRTKDAIWKGVCWESYAEVSKVLLLVEKIKSGMLRDNYFFSNLVWVITQCCAGFNYFTEQQKYEEVVALQLTQFWDWISHWCCCCSDRLYFPKHWIISQCNVYQLAMIKRKVPLTLNAAPFVVHIEIARTQTRYTTNDVFQPNPCRAILKSIRGTTFLLFPFAEFNVKMFKTKTDYITSGLVCRKLIKCSFQAVFSSKTYLYL